MNSMTVSWFMTLQTLLLLNGHGSLDNERLWQNVLGQVIILF